MCKIDYKNITGNIVEQKIHRDHLEACLRYYNFIKHLILSICSISQLEISDKAKSTVNYYEHV